MSTEFQYDVFLSHNQADKPRVRRLAAGLRVWFDEWEVPVAASRQSAAMIYNPAFCRKPLRFL